MIEELIEVVVTVAVDVLVCHTVKKNFSAGLSFSSDCMTLTPPSLGARPLSLELSMSTESLRMRRSLRPVQAWMLADAGGGTKRKQVESKNAF